jgi:hypothetical protein
MLDKVLEDTVQEKKPIQMKWTMALKSAENI